MQSKELPKRVSINLMRRIMKKIKCLHINQEEHTNLQQEVIREKIFLKSTQKTNLNSVTEEIKFKKLMIYSKNLNKSKEQLLWMWTSSM